MLRAYDDGVAYRLRTALPGPLRIRHEEARFVFPEGAVLRAPLVECRATPGVDCFRTSFEETYTTGPLASFDPGRMAILPVLVEAPGGPKVVITEADLDEYPGLWLSRALRYGADHRRFDRTVTAADRLTLRLASGGGWAGRFEGS